MLNQDFCKLLEYKITKALSYSTDAQLKGFWCDGVLFPYSEDEHLKKHINDRREIVMTAFAGETGQDKYELTLRFGKKALSRYARELSIKECIANSEDNDWFEIDTVNKKMVVHLN